MNNIIKKSETLPAKINELKNFIAIRRREITAYRAKLRALDDIGLIEKRKEILTEAQNKAEEVLGAEAELGEMIMGIDKSKSYTGFGKRNSVLPPGITKKQSYEVQKINKHWGIAEDFMEEARRKEEIATHTGVIKWINANFRPTTPPMPEGNFTVIYADPPWEYDFSETQTRAIESKYPTMTIDSICNMKIPSDKDAVLFLWATAPKLPEAMNVLNSWGFKYVTNSIWDKEIIGMGYWFRGQHEMLLVGVRGEVHPAEEGLRNPSVYRERRTKHSHKPDKYYEYIEKMFPDCKKIELFQTKPREGWIGWGTEIESH